MTNSERLQQSYRECGTFLEQSALNLKEAYQELEIGNMEIRDFKTLERIRDIKLRYADLECLAKQFMAIRFIEKPSEDKKTSQCYNCEGAGYIRDCDDITDIPCPVCDGSGTLAIQ